MLSVFSPDRGTPEEFLADAVSPSVTSDGGTLAYLSWGDPRTLGALWRVGADGRGAAQLTPGARWPRVTRDDRSVVYMAERGMWTVPLDGGTPTQLFDVPVETRVPDLSPDGTSIAFVALADQSRPTITVCRLPACASPRRLTPPGLTMAEPDGGPIRWTPDGRGIAYVNVEPQPNIWIQRLDGSLPRQFTRFTDGRTIPDFAWSRDGARLAIVRAATSTNIILFRGLRPASQASQIRRSSSSGVNQEWIRVLSARLRHPSSRSRLP